MATLNQIEANKANAQKSTGPRTDEGKAKSSRYRLSHGFASSARIIPGEDRQELRELLFDLMREHQPATPTEQILVEKMAMNQWLSLRAFSLQALVFADPEASDTRHSTPQDLALLIRYHTSAENAFHKAYNQLVKAQKERKNSEIGFEPQNAGQTADPPPDQPKTGPKTAPLACVHTDFPAEPATSATEIAPEAPEILKQAA
jgi:hypothetical protein